MEYEEFKKKIFQISDINLDYYKEKQMKRRINSLIAKNGYNNYDSYLTAIRDNNRMYEEFINYLTINVSEFYRNPEQWQVLETHIIPQLIEKSTNIKIWSSACSTGDEPYTLVMVLNKFLQLEKIKVLASDIDKLALEKARIGSYNQKSVEKLPAEYLEKFFVKTGDTYAVKDKVKKCVQFRRINLLKDEYPQGCNLILCRNVLIYFTEKAKNLIYKKFNRSLVEGGTLFVGSTEQIIMSGKYNFRPVKTFFYTREKSQS